MGKAKITITGETIKSPKVNDDKTVVLTFKIDMSENVPKGLKSLGSSPCVARVGAKTWKKVSNSVSDNSFFIVQGEPKVRVNNKGVPFLEVVAFDISLKPEISQKKELKEDITQKIDEKKELKQPDNKGGKKQELAPKKQNKQKKSGDSNKKQPSKQSMFIEWYKKEEIIFVSYKDLVLTEKIHLYAKELKLNGVLKTMEYNKTLKTPIAVRRLDNGEYSLVMGLKQYIIAKVFTLENIPVVIKDMSYDEFLKKYKNK